MSCDISMFKNNCCKHIMKILSFDVGIKNLAYCIIDKTEDDFDIIDWDVINISDQDKKEKHTCSFVIGKRKCGKYSNKYYLDNETKLGLCKTHADDHKDIVSKKYFRSIADESDDEDEKVCARGTKRKCKDVLTYKKNDIEEFYCDKHYAMELKKIIKEHKLQKVKNQNVNYESNFVLSKNMYERLDKVEDMLTVDQVIIENQPSLKNPVMKNIASLLFGYFMLRGVMEDKIELVKFMSPLNKLKMDKEITDKVLSQYDKKHEIKRATKKLGITYTKILLDNKKDKLKFVEQHSKIDDLCDSFLQGYYHLYKDEGFNLDVKLYNKMTNPKKIVI